MVYGCSLGPLASACDLYTKSALRPDQKLILLRYWEYDRCFKNQAFQEKQVELDKLVKEISASAETAKSDIISKIQSILVWFAEQKSQYSPDCSSK